MELLAFLAWIGNQRWAPLQF